MDIKLLAGAYVNTNAPVYGSSSVLKYSTVEIMQLTGMDSRAGSGTGVPANIEINTTNPLRLTASTYYKMTGNLLIDNGAELQLSPSANGDLWLKGTFTNNGTFDGNGRSLGSMVHQLKLSIQAHLPLQQFSWVDVNNSAGVTLQTINGSNIL